MDTLAARNKDSQLISQKWEHLPAESKNRAIIGAIIYAIDNCLACGKTAASISREINSVGASEIPTVAKTIFTDLADNQYFKPDQKMNEIIRFLN